MKTREQDEGRKAAGYSHGFIIGNKALSCACVCVGVCNMLGVCALRHHFIYAHNAAQ